MHNQSQENIQNAADLSTESLETKSKSVNDEEEKLEERQVIVSQEKTENSILNEDKKSDHLKSSTISDEDIRFKEETLGKENEIECQSFG